jgi:hypothetical protein
MVHNLIASERVEGAAVCRPDGDRDVQVNYINSLRSK